MRKPGAAIVASYAAFLALLAGCGGSGSGAPSGGIPHTNPGPPATPESIIVAFASAPNAIAGFAESFPLTVTVKDRNGNVIQGTYPVAITLSDSDTTGATKLSTATITSSAQSVSLDYSGARITGSIIISASAPGVAAASVTSATLQSDGTHSYVGGERYAYSRSTTLKRYGIAGQLLSSDTELDDVTVTVQRSPAVFNGHSGLIDVTTSSVSSDGSTQETADDYYAYVSGSPVQLDTYGGTDNETIATPGYPSITLTDVLSYDAPSVVDELPQAQGVQWNPAQGSVEMITIDDPVDGDDSREKWITAADGSYQTAWKSVLSDGLEYAQIAVSSDASFNGTDAASEFGLLWTNLYTVAAPAGGTIAYHHDCRMEIDLPAQPLLPISASEFPTPAPSATPGNVGVCNNDQNSSIDATVASWYPANFAPLDQESTRVVGVNAAIPADCNVAPSIATVANHLQYQQQLLDPTLSLTQRVSDDYYAPNTGLVCSLQSTTRTYHDWTTGALGVTETTSVRYGMISNAGARSASARFMQSRPPAAFVATALHRLPLGFRAGRVIQPNSSRVLKAKRFLTEENR